MAKRDKRTLESMIEELYSHNDVANAILTEIRSADEEQRKRKIASKQLSEDEIDLDSREQKILRGELTLPSEHDAARHVSGLAEQETGRHWREVGRDGGPKHDARSHAEALARMEEYMGGQL